MVVLTCVTLKMLSGAPGLVCQDTRTLPAPALASPEQTLELCSSGGIRPSPGKGEPIALPRSEILQKWLLRSRDLSAGPALSQGSAQPCTAPGGQGVLGEDKGEESHALPKGSFAGGRSSQYYLLKKLIIVYSGASQTPRLPWNYSLCAAWAGVLSRVQVARSRTEVQEEGKVKPF